MKNHTFKEFSQSVLEKTNNEIMIPNTKRHNDFVNANRKVYPDRKKTMQLDKSQKLFKDVKNNLTK